MRIRTFVRILTCCAIAAALAACSKTSTAGSGTGGRTNSWTQPHVLRMADAGDVNTLNPHLGQFADVGYVAQMTMAWLVRWDENNNPYPELATEIPTQANGGVSKDGLTITYHLRKGVKWADGVPFDADDVVFSTKVVLNTANDEIGRLGWDQIASVAEPDKFTVVYHMKKPYSPFVETFFSTAGANPCILPKHLLAQYPNINNVPYNALPVGIGPFKVQRWDRAQQVVMVANPLYWRGRPKLDEVIFKIIPDRNTLESQIQAHEVDLWYTMPGSYLDRLRDTPGFTTFKKPGYIYNHIDFNLQRPGDSDPAVRAAIRLATDRATILQKIGHGLGSLQDVTTPLTAPYSVTSIQKTPFDIAQANALLDKAGWKLGADGVRAKNGTRLALDLYTVTGSNDTDEQIELIRQTWKQIGVTFSVHHVQSAIMFAPSKEGGVVYGDKWDVIFFAWQNEAIGDMMPIYGCHSFPPAGQNNLRWCNQRAQAAMDALFGHFEQSQRNGDVLAIQQEFVKDVPSIVTYIRQDAYLYNSDLKGYHPNNVSQFDNMMNVDI